MNWPIITSAVLALAALAFAPLAQPAQTYSGDAYDLASGVLRYHESHYSFDAGGTQQRLVLYRCQDGRPFARKLIRDDGNPQAPDFEMVDARLGYREGVRGNRSAREVYVRRSADVPEQSEPLNLPADGVIDAGFDAYVRAHWAALAHSATLNLPFLVPSKRAFYTFQLAKVENDSNSTKLALRLSLGAWYAFLAPHIDVVYDRATHRLLRFEGMSNLRDEALKNYNVRIEFPHAAAPLTTNQLATALATPLTASCADVRADTATSAVVH